MGDRRGGVDGVVGMVRWDDEGIGGEVVRGKGSGDIGGVAYMECPSLAAPPFALCEDKLFLCGESARL